MIIGAAEGWVGVDADESVNWVAVFGERRGGFDVAAVVEIKELIERIISEAVLGVSFENFLAGFIRGVLGADEIVEVIFVVILSEGLDGAGGGLLGREVENREY